MNKYGGKINRKGQISIEDGKKRFIEYYDDPLNGKTKLGQLRGKMFDMMYQKKPKYNFKCNHSNKNIELDNGFILEPGKCEPGSNKYLLEKGPKTFDLEGIDSFLEDTEVQIPNEEDDETIISRGSTYYTDNDNHINDDELEELNDGKKISNKIYGPRLNNGELYNMHFKNKYNSKYRNDKSKLVRDYWRRFHNFELDPDGNPYKYSRYNRTTKKKP